MHKKGWMPPMHNSTKLLVGFHQLPDLGGWWCLSKPWLQGRISKARVAGQPAWKPKHRSIVRSEHSCVQDKAIQDAQDIVHAAQLCQSRLIHQAHWWNLSSFHDQSGQIKSVNMQIGVVLRIATELTARTIRFRLTHPCSVRAEAF